MEQVRRGYVPEDEAFFYREESLGKLCQAQKDLLYLIERGYPMKMPLYLQEITICCPNGSALLWSGPPPPARQPPYAETGKSLARFLERRCT